LVVVAAVALFFVAALGIGGWLLYRGFSTPGSPIQKSFDKNFLSSCQTEAIKKGVTQEIAQKYCECALAKFRETKSMDQATTFCAAQVQPK